MSIEFKFDPSLNDEIEAAFGIFSNLSGFGRIGNINDLLNPLISSMTGINNFFNEDPDLIDITNTYIREWCKVEEISYSFLREVIKLWKSKGDFPSLDNIIEYYNENPCECSANMNDDDRKAMIRIFLINTGGPPSCVMSEIFQHYLTQYNAIPTYDTIMSLIRTMARALTSEYFDEKVKVGTKNLEHIKTFTKTDDVDADCSLCLEKIERDQTYHKLEPCGHLFHAKGSECIDSTIVKWLTDNHTCPNCRKDVDIKPDE